MRRRVLIGLAVAVVALGLTAAAPAGGQSAGPVDTLQQASTDFNVTNVDVLASVGVGEEVTVNATIENEGGDFGSQDITFSIGNNNDTDRAVVQDVFLDIGESRTVQATLNTSGFEPGPAGVAVITDNDTATRTISLVGSSAEYFAVTNLSAPQSVVTGSEFTADVTIENTGNEFDAQSVEMALTGPGGTTDTVRFTTSLDIGESRTFEVTLNATGFDTGTAMLNASTANETATRAVSVTAPATTNFTITDLTAPGSATPDSTVSVNATVENVGDDFGAQDVDFGLFGPGPNNDTVVVEDVFLDIGASKTVQATLNTSGFQSGTATLTVDTDDDTARQNVSIVAERTADFQIVGLFAPSNATVGSTVSVDAAIENTGDAFGTRDVAFGLFGSGPNNDTATVENVSLDIGERRIVQVTLDTAGFQSGTATVTVDTGDDSARRNATLTVREDSGNWRQDGFDERNTGYSPGGTAVAAFPQVDWRFDIKTDYENGGRKGGRTIARSAVTVVDGNAYVGDRAGLTSAAYLYSMDASTGDYRWRSSVTGFNPGMQTTPAVSGGRVFFGDDAATLWALNVSNGSVAWNVNLGSGTASDAAYSPTVVGDSLYVTNDGGKLFAYDTSDGSQQWVHESSRSHPGTHAPAVSDGRVYYSTSTGAGGAQLYAVDTVSGNEVWNRTFAGTAGWRMTSPTVGNDTLYVSDPATSRLLVFGADNGTTLWNVSVDADVRAPPAYAEGVAYVTDESGSLYAVDEDSESIVWERELGNTFQSSPSVANGVVYAGDTNGELYAVDADSGQLLWSERLDGSIDAAPTPINGRVYVGGNNFAYAFEGPAEPWSVQRTVTGRNGSVTPGDTVDVTLNASVGELPPEGDLAIEETVSGLADAVTVDQVTVDGTAVTPNGSTATANGIDVTLDRAVVEGARSITVSYAVSVLANASRGSTIGLDGRLAFNGSEQLIGTEQVQVQVDRPTVVGDPVTDIDGDGRFEDVNGDGQFTPADVTALFTNRNGAAVQDNQDLFDFNDDGQFTPADVTRLFSQVL